jgi:serine/threonine protein kinase
MLEPLYSPPKVNVLLEKPSNQERLFLPGSRIISMPSEVYLDQYRLTTPADGRPVEIARNGPAVTYKGSDSKSGAPVALTLIPIGSVHPDARERFEEKARTAMLLDHLNIARTVAFGATGDSFVFVSEYPQGETVDEWVKANGPMPPDAVLRVALQVVAALGAASFHGLTHPAIQPANIIIVTGKTAEGGWPLIKLTQFALAGLKSAPGHSDPDLGASEYASPEQLLQGRIDFRSEMFSLGATMCFLLTGVFYSAYPRWPQTRRFARPLRTLIAQTLEDDPELRPQDPVLFTEQLRNCLTTIERRQSLRRRFGIPFSPLVAKPPRVRRIRRRGPKPLLAPIGSTRVEPERPAVPRRSRLRPVLAAAAVLFVLALIGALFLPEDVVTAALHGRRPVETVGVPVGVPDSTTASTVALNSAAAASTAPRAADVGSGQNRQSDASSAPPADATAAAGSAGSAVTPEAAAPRAAEPPPAAPATVPQQSVAPVVAQQLDARLINPAANNEPTANSSPQQSEHPSAPATVGYATETGPTAFSSPSKPAAQSSTLPAQSAPAVVAANNRAPEPPPPADAPEQDIAANQGPTAAVAEPNIPAVEPATTAVEPGTTTQPAANADRSAVASSSSDKTDLSHRAASRTRKAASPTAKKENHPVKSRVPRALPAEPDRPANGSGMMNADVVGVTPNGNVILELPSGERAIVSPQDADQYSHRKATHRRTHRVIIERRIAVPPPPYAPYQPFLPPDA